MPCAPCSPAADAKNVRITTEADSWLGFIQGDSARLEQVVANLLSNAVKFTPDNGTVHVRLKRIQDCVEIQVRDTGQGMSADFLPYIFEPFRQADGSTTRVHGGLGLGLSIVKHLVEAHGGSVEAQSAGVGQGATVIARFPIDPACANDSHRPVARAISAVAVETLSLDNVRVLVVDDDEESRVVVAEHLRRCHGVVFTATSAADAYDVLRRERVDVLLADIAMPGEDGYTLIRRVREGVVPVSASIPAAAITAFAREEDRLLAHARRVPDASGETGRSRRPGRSRRQTCTQETTGAGRATPGVMRTSRSKPARPTARQSLLQTPRQWRRSQGRSGAHLAPAAAARPSRSTPTPDRHSAA